MKEHKYLGLILIGEIFREGNRELYTQRNLFIKLRMKVLKLILKLKQL